MSATPCAGPISLPRLLMQASPFLHVREAAALLGLKSYATVHGRLEEGRLRAIDISSRWPSKQRDLRIYRYTVCQELIEGVEPGTPPRLDWLLPHERPAFSRDEVCRLLRSRPRHIAILTKAGALHGPEPPMGTSKTVAALIPITFRWSLLTFLREREVRP